MPILSSILDRDLYDCTQMQTAFHQFTQNNVPVNVRYKFFCRDKEVDLRPILPRLELEIEDFQHLQFDASELEYLKTLPFMKRDFIDILEHYSLADVGLATGQDLKNASHGGIHITVSGPWLNTILYPQPILAMCNQLYFEHTTDYKKLESTGIARLNEKIAYVKRNADAGFKFADFGTRRRYSKKWQQFVIEQFKLQLPDNFIGTSNVMFAKNMGLRPIGTFAHEFVMVFQGLAESHYNSDISLSQKLALATWLEENGDKLGIALSDTLTFDYFLKDFNKELANKYAGCRHDSGDPYNWCHKLIAHYQSLGIDPMTKVAVFSDGLDIPRAVTLYNLFKDKINMVFGIGTNLTNDLGPKPLSIVMKMVECNDQPLIKFSDEPGKIMCEDSKYAAKFAAHLGIKIN